MVVSQVYDCLSSLSIKAVVLAGPSVKDCRGSLVVS
jgi:hypothetical protein